MTPPDYRSLIDAETWAFIDRTASFYPPGAADLDVAGQRQVYDAMCRGFHAGRPKGLMIEDSRIGFAPVRTYLPDSPTGTVVYLHGGGFVVGGLESHDDICAEIAAEGLRVVSVDYRLSPEHSHPAAFIDAYQAVEETARQHGPVVLVGDSAGGTLAASVTRAMRGREAVRGQVLIYPLLGHQDDGSRLTHAEAPMLTRADLAVYAALRGGRPDDPTAHPLAEPDLTGLPPTVAFSAGCDPLADDGRLYVERLRAAGGPADWTLEPGLVHGYLRARHSVERARDSFRRIRAAIRQMAG